MSPLRNTLDTFFPIPDTLRMPTVGLDISDRSIKYMELVTTHRGTRIGRFGLVKIPDGVISSGVVRDTEALTKILSQLQKDLDIDMARVSVSEEQVYLFELTVPRIESDKIDDAILFQIEEQVPVGKHDLIFDHTLLFQDERNFHIQVHAIQKHIIEEYTNVLVESGFSPLSFELEPQATARALVPHQDYEQVMIIDIGHTQTSISISFNGVIVFTTTVNFDVDQLAQEVQDTCEVTKKQADILLYDTGFDESQHTDTTPEDFTKMLRDHTSHLVRQIKKYYTYWQTHRADNSSAIIDAVLLCGGGANIPNITEYLSDETELEVLLAPVWDIPVYQSKDKKKKNIPQRELLGYSVALGLARGDFLYD